MGATISELPLQDLWLGQEVGGNQDDQSATQYHVEPVENKEFLSYSPVSFQNVRIYQNLM